MNELKERINRVARTSGCVLIRGESGVGKELVARALHRASPRADRPMLSVNCAAIPAELMESQLFGHKAGAFTGADRDHEGYFQQADSGTLFLDEVGELTWEGQAKLLRILEGHPFLPVGATQQISVDVRVIAATNQNLQDYVRRAQIPRGPVLSAQRVRTVRAAAARSGKRHRRCCSIFSSPTSAINMADRGWRFPTPRGKSCSAMPGRAMFASCAMRSIAPWCWPMVIRSSRGTLDCATRVPSELESLRFDYWERRLINEALKRTSGNIPEAAKLLAIGRATLYRKIEEYGIER